MKQAILLIALLLASCDSIPTQVQPTTKPNLPAVSYWKAVDYSTRYQYLTFHENQIDSLTDNCGIAHSAWSIRWRITNPETSYITAPYGYSVICCAIDSNNYQLLGCKKTLSVNAANDTLAWGESNITGYTFYVRSHYGR